MQVLLVLVKSAGLIMLRILEELCFRFEKKTVPPQFDHGNKAASIFIAKNKL